MSHGVVSTVIAGLGSTVHRLKRKLGRRKRKPGGKRGKLGDDGGGGGDGGDGGYDGGGRDGGYDGGGCDGSGGFHVGDVGGGFHGGGHHHVGDGGGGFHGGGHHHVGDGGGGGGGGDGGGGGGGGGGDVGSAGGGWNLIQPCKRNSSGEIKSCRVHDVLRVTLAVTAKKQDTMTNLRKVGMQVPKGYGSSRSAFGSIAQSLSHLHSLYLQGGLEDLPAGAFGKLTKLTLDSSCLRDDPFSGLQTLQSLKSLRLINNAYQGKTLCCSEGGLPCLEVLNLENLKDLRDVVMESGAFRQLKFMRIASCGNLHMIPRGLVSISSLQELRLVDMAALLPDGVQPNMGKDGGCEEDTKV
ncbi:hypothetical protein EJ110_NYTH00666 [Nymphaea thermarum]|nr:hypothetical protein EJ110_NYTH00666 [Nymphaea thermarum]